MQVPLRGDFKTSRRLVRVQCTFCFSNIKLNNSTHVYFAFRITHCA